VSGVHGGGGVDGESDGFGRGRDGDDDEQLKAETRDPKGKILKDERWDDNSLT
jgi:hypothetical protein